MSRQLSRIRSMVSEIEEIQKQGQKDAQQWTPGVAASISPFSLTESSPIQTPTPSATQAPAPEPFESKSGQFHAVEPARVSLELSANVVAVLQIENSDERVEVRQLDHAIEIRFRDGKAVHLPLKNVA